MTCVARSCKGVFLALGLWFVPVWAAAQPHVLKPDASHVYDSVSLLEWIYRSADWAYTSFDLALFDPAPMHTDFGRGNNPALFVNGVRIQADWKGQSMLHLPNVTLSVVDSVMVYPPGSMVGHVFAPYGAIDIHLRSPGHAGVEAGTINQVNDPGPLYETEYSTRNVERVKEFVNVSARSARGRYETDVFVNLSSYSYSHGRNFDLYNRTYNPDTPDRYPYQTQLSAVQTHRFSTPARTYSVVTGVSHFLQNYVWDEAVGVEIPGSYSALMIGVGSEPTRGLGLSVAASYSARTFESIQNRHDVRYVGDEHGFTSHIGYTWPQASIGLTTDREPDLTSLQTTWKPSPTLHITGVAGLERQAVLARYQSMRNGIRPYVRYAFWSDTTSHHVFTAGIGAGTSAFRWGFEANNRLRFSGHLTAQAARISSHTRFGIVPFAGINRYSTIDFSQSVRFQMNPTFQMAASLDAAGARTFDEHPHPFRDVDPLLRASLAFKQTLFRNRLHLHLILRNLFSSTETQNPNGLIYDLSMETRVRFYF